MNKLTKILIATNILMFAMVVAVIIKYKYQAKVRSEMSKTKVAQAYNYSKNRFYKEQMDLFTAYTSQRNVVMLGDSHTYLAHWNELLDRGDIANRGINSDNTGGYVNRLNEVLKINPRICFIEGGINDIEKDIPREETIKNLSSIIDSLQKYNITPVFTKVFYVTKKYPLSAAINKKIKELNTEMDKITTLKHIRVIDLNPLLTDGEYLNPNFSIDGIHLLGKGYLIWRDEVLKILTQEKI